MSRWSDSFKQHPFITTLQAFADQTEQVDIPKELTSDYMQEYARVIKVVSYLQTITKSIDPELISVTPLNEAQGQIQHAYNHFNNFINNKNVSHLNNCNSHLDAVLNITSRMFTFYKKPIKTDLTSIVDTYSSAFQDNVTKQEQLFNDKFSETKTQANDLSNSMAKVQQDLSNLTKDLNGVQQQIQTQVTEFGTQFQDAQIDRASKFDKELETLNHKVDKEFEKLVTKAGQAIMTLHKLRDDAEAVFGVVQNTVQAGAHQAYANKEKSAANRYRWAAISLMILACFILIAPTAFEIYTLWGDENTKSVTSYDWMNMLKRLPISLILFAPAYYLGKESAKHRENEVHNRRTELVLRTIDPYIALIGDDKKRDELKGSIAHSVFGGSASKPALEADTFTASDARNILRAFQTAIKGNTPQP